MVQACDNINDQWDCFHKTFADGENLFVPVSRKYAVENKKQWMTKEFKNLAKKKKTMAWNTYLGAKSFSNWTFYKKIRNSVTNAVKSQRLTLNTNLSMTCLTIRKPFATMSD